jgi:hypothetical protein
MIAYPGVPPAELGWAMKLAHELSLMVNVSLNVISLLLDLKLCIENIPETPANRPVLMLPTTSPEGVSSPGKGL